VHVGARGVLHALSYRMLGCAQVVSRSARSSFRVEDAVPSCGSEVWTAQPYRHAYVVSSVLRRVRTQHHRAAISPPLGLLVAPRQGLNCQPDGGTVRLGTPQSWAEHQHAGGQVGGRVR
jgi:hypothetical protein